MLVMFVSVKNMFIGLLTGLVNRSNHTKCDLSEMYDSD